MTTKIALTYIVKDNSELEVFQKSLKSFMPYFDGLFVVVNGLSGEHDLIHKEVKKYKGSSISINPETHPEPYYKHEDGTWEFVNFAAARQISFDMVTPDFEYISWADTDDLLQGGTEIRPIVQAAKQQGIDMVYCTYYYSCIFNKDGSIKEPVIFHERERIIRNTPEFKWDKWLHEVCIPHSKPVSAYKMQKHSHNPKNGINLLWVHTADMAKSTKALMRNVHILEMQAKHEEYKDPRTILYIAKTYFDIGTEEKLISADKYLDMYIPMSGWDEEISVAYHYKGLIRQRLGRDRESIPYYKEAIKVYPKNHIDYLRLVDALFKVGDYDTGSIYLSQASVLPEMESKATIGNPYEVKILFLTLKYQEAQQKGDLQGMEHFAKLRSEYVTDGLVDDVAKTKELNDVAKGIYNYAIYLLKNQPDNLEDLILTIKKPFVDEQFVMQLSNSRPPKEWKDNEIVYYASFGQKHFEEWTAKSLDKGVGGSESAVIYLSKEWIKQGYKVVVYCDCGNDAGTYDGVEYRHYNTINFKDKFSTIIFWRSPHLLDIPFLEAKRIFMDLHDIADMTHWTPERVKKVNKVFFKSKWHRRNLPNIPNDKAVIISNGINL